LELTLLVLKLLNKDLLIDYPTIHF
jgi:hypothetical protein